MIGELKDVEPVTDLGYRVERHRYCSEKLIETADRVLDHYGNDEASALLAFAVRQILFDVAQAELALSVALLESAVEKAS